MSRYKSVGWRNDNYRHSLAARGVRTSFLHKGSSKHMLTDKNRKGEKIISVDIWKEKSAPVLSKMDIDEIFNKNRINSPQGSVFRYTDDNKIIITKTSFENMSDPERRRLWRLAVGGVDEEALKDRESVPFSQKTIEMLDDWAKKTSFGAKSISAKLNAFDENILKNVSRLKREQVPRELLAYYDSLMAKPKGKERDARMKVEPKKVKVKSSVKAEGADEEIAEDEEFEEDSLNDEIKGGE